MNGLDTNKIKLNLVKYFTQALDDRLVAIILAGSLPDGTYKDGWSDIDLLIVVDTLDLKIKLKIANVVARAENDSGIHHGINVISREELFTPIAPHVLLEGKTIQALIDLKKYPDRLIYSLPFISIENIYSPNNDTLKKYSLNNIGMFLLRNRKTLATKADDKNIKELLKKEIRASLIITKLAVQYFTGRPQENHLEVLKQAKYLFPDFDFKVIEDNFLTIEKWHKLKDGEEIKSVFKKVDVYIEEFTHYVFKKSKNN